MVVDVRLRSSWDKVFRAMQAKAEWVALAQQLRDHINANANLPAEIRGVWREAGTVSRLAAERGVPINRDEMGRSLQAIIDSGLELLSFFNGWVSDAAKHGHAVEGAAELRGLIAEVRTIRSQALDHWPWTPPPAEVEQMVAECEAGESTALDETFARAAGLSEEAWGQLIEERQSDRGLLPG